MLTLSTKADLTPLEILHFFICFPSNLAHFSCICLNLAPLIDFLQNEQIITNIQIKLSDIGMSNYSQCELINHSSFSMHERFDKDNPKNKNQG